MAKTSENIEQLTRDDLIKYLSVILDLLKKLQLFQKQLSKGEKGDKPIAGVDYPIPRDGKDVDEKKVIKEVLRQIPKPKDGYTPVKGKDYFDGKDADVTQIVLEAATLAISEVTEQIPTIEDIEKDLPKLGEKIRDGLELLQGDERLKIEAIDNLREELDELKKKIQVKTSNFIGGGLSGGGRIVKSYDLSTYLDGVTKVFSLPVMWRIISIHSSSFPTAFRETIDYVHDASGNTLTFTSEIEASTTLAAGQTITIIYGE